MLDQGLYVADNKGEGGIQAVVLKKEKKPIMHNEKHGPPKFFSSKGEPQAETHESAPTVGEEKKYYKKKDDWTKGT